VGRSARQAREGQADKRSVTQANEGQVGKSHLRLRNGSARQARVRMRQVGVWQATQWPELSDGKVIAIDSNLLVSRGHV
jgi:hypothetical protein